MNSSSSTLRRQPHGPSTTVRAALPRPHTLASNKALDMSKLLRCVLDQPDFTGVAFFDSAAKRLSGIRLQTQIRCDLLPS